MKLKLSPEWFDQMAEQEEGHEIAAGVAAHQPKRTSLRIVDAHLDQEQVAFSTLIQLLRRQQGLSIDKLAEVARVEVAELLGIESDPHFEPKPRTVHQLADYFELPVQPLTRLSGLPDGRRSQYADAAIRFAAKSKGVQTLNTAEEAALSEFVKFLCSTELDNESTACCRT